MAVTHDDVRHVAELARLAVDEEGLDHLVGELNGILVHVDALSQVDTAQVEKSVFSPTGGTPLRSDSSGPLPMARPLRSFAPAVKDGFILVHRLATHEAASDGAA